MNFRILGTLAVLASLDHLVLAADPLSNWTVRSPFPTLYGVTYGDAQFVAVGESGIVVTSPDGVTWTPRDSGTTNRLYGIAYGGAQFAVVGGQDTILTSPDGVTWTPRHSGTNTLHSVAYGNGQFVATGGGFGSPNVEEGFARVFTSSNGVDWAASDPGGDVLYAIAYGNGVFVGVEGLTLSSVVSSSDGRIWSKPVNLSPLFPLTGVAFGRGQFVVVGLDGSIATSADGTSWTPQRLAADKNLNGIWYGSGVFVAIGGDFAGLLVGTPMIISSSDGVTWATHNAGTTNGLSAVAYGNGRFVAVGEAGTILVSGPIISFGTVSLGGDGTVQGTVIGQPGQKYGVETSTNLVDWLPLTTLVSTNGTAQFFDSTATNFSRRFYRAVAP